MSWSGAAEVARTPMPYHPHARIEFSLDSTGREVENELLEKRDHERVGVRVWAMQVRFSLSWRETDRQRSAVCHHDEI